MAGFRDRKNAFAALLLPPAWPEDAPKLPLAVAAIDGLEAVGPLLALLPRGGLLSWRAVLVLGRVLAAMAARDMEKARILMRRCQWHMNEDSGNMGWGIAETMGEAAARSPALAREYGRVILSYARETGFADNFIDHAALRRGVYWSIGRFSPLYPAYREEGLELLVRGLEDEDPISRGFAAWGVGRQGGAWDFGPVLRQQVCARLAAVTEQTSCAFLDGLRYREASAADLAQEALAVLGAVAGG